MKLNALLISTDGTRVDDAVAPHLTIGLGDLTLVDRVFTETGADLAPAVSAAIHATLLAAVGYHSFDNEAVVGANFYKTELPVATVSVVTNNALNGFDVSSTIVDISVLQASERIELIKDYYDWAIPSDVDVVDIRMINKLMTGERT